MAKLREGLLAALAISSLVLSADRACAHELAMDQLILMPDRETGVLRGQLTFDPHRTRGTNAPPPPDIEERLSSLLGREITLEIDGAACPARYEVRELWVPAGATLGDVVNVTCPLGSAAKELRVSVARSITAFAVTVQRVARDAPPVSHSVMLRAGESTPVYGLSGTADGWLLGGAEQFQPEAAGVATPPASAAPAVPPAPAPPSGLQRALLVLGLGVAPAAFVFALVGAVTGVRRWWLARISGGQRPRPSSFP